MRPELNLKQGIVNLVLLGCIPLAEKEKLFCINVKIDVTNYMAVQLEAAKRWREKLWHSAVLLCAYSHNLNSWFGSDQKSVGQFFLCTNY